MTIINAKYEPKKSERMRELAKSIAGDKEKAAFFETEGDFKAFCQFARDLGFKPRSKKQSSGGWRVWVR